MTIEKPVNACHRCGATAYKPVITRDPQGNMRPSGQYQCVKCLLVFSSMSEWRGETPIQPAPSAQPSNQPVAIPADRANPSDSAQPNTGGQTPTGHFPF